ncbi:unnamed protein product [Linum trigynum]|uniref:Uncharacterized protein n=1 Tax=Linum trigynum TaxID=586398 RepID=A0AAV2E5B0_9ROSI
MPPLGLEPPLTGGDPSTLTQQSSPMLVSKRAFIVSTSPSSTSKFHPSHRRSLSPPPLSPPLYSSNPKMLWISIWLPHPARSNHLKLQIKARVTTSSHSRMYYHALFMVSISD